MIVENKEKTLEKADEISTKLLSYLSNEARMFSQTGDPSEIIYLNCHTIGNLFARVFISLKKYASVYGMNLDYEMINKWIQMIVKENIDMNENKVK